MHAIDTEATSPRRRGWWVYGGLLLAIVLLLVAVATVGIVTRGGARRIRVGADTTYLSEPVGADGMIDYLAAINQLAASGVQPDQNAVVDLLRAFGPSELPMGLRPKYFDALEIPPIPVEGNYYVPMEKVVVRVTPAGERSAAAAASSADNDEELDWGEQLDVCLQQPWRAAEFPLIDAWLNQNREPLDWILKASSREQYFSPLLTSDGSPGMHAALLPIANLRRNAVRLLCARATRSWGAGQPDPALDDCLAGLRLARLGSQSPTLIDSLIAIACQRIAGRSLERIATAPELTSDQLRRVIAEIEHLPPMTPMWTKNDRCERFSYLSTTTIIARHGLAGLAQDTGLTFFGTSPQAATSWLASMSVDWNLVMRDGNQWYDEIVRLGKIADYREFQAAATQFQQSFDMSTAQFRGAGRSLRSMLTIRGRSELMGGVLTQLLLPAVKAAYNAEHRNRMTMDLTVLSLWLEVFRREQGQYPDDLQQLVPVYCSSIPGDRFSGQPLKYHKTDEGYVLYSVGPDLFDDGGKDLDGSSGDLVVRTPAVVVKP